MRKKLEERKQQREAAAAAAAAAADVVPTPTPSEKPIIKGQEEKEPEPSVRKHWGEGNPGVVLAQGEATGIVQEGMFVCAYVRVHACTCIDHVPIPPTQRRHLLLCLSMVPRPRLRTLPLPPLQPNLWWEELGAGKGSSGGWQTQLHWWQCCKTKPSRRQHMLPPLKVSKSEMKRSYVISSLS